MSTTHPDDEQLSAFLDGEADGDAAAHIAGCADCSARVEALRSVASAVAAPLPQVGPAARDAAIANALAAAEAGSLRTSVTARMVCADGNSY